MGIAEWHCSKRDAVTKKSNPAFSSNSQSVQCILAQISLSMYSTLRISLHLQHSQAKQNNAHLCRQSLTMSSACIFTIHIVERFVWDVHGWGQQLNTGNVKRIGVVYGLCVSSTLTPWIHHRQQWGQRRCPAFQSSYSTHSCCCSRITCSSIWKRWSPSLRSKPISSWNTRSEWVYRFSTYVIFW